jgi:hypothetical protein
MNKQTLSLSIDGELLYSLVEKSSHNFVEFERGCLQEVDGILNNYLQDVIDYVLIYHNVFKIEEM